MPYSFAATTTPGGYRIDEVASALQKACRRSQVDDALYWATELDLAGFGNYAWKRLRIIASEDIGVADPLLVCQLAALYSSWLDEKKQDKDHKTGRHFFAHAVVLCAQASKSRMIDHALWVHYFGQRDSRPIPDEAIDQHTARGRDQGRGLEHFIAEAARLEPPPTVQDIYQERAHAQVAARLARGGPRPTGPTYAGQPAGSLFEGS